MRRTLITIVVVFVTIGVLGYLAHTFDLIGLAKSLHSGGVPAP
ncbi:MAG: hypothetical protein ACYC0C_12880 [Devosia sp.]